MDRRVEVSLRRRRMTPSIAAPSGSKARCPSTGMCEFAPARLAQDAMGSRANRMLARPSCPAPMALVTFPERKVTRAVGRRGKRHGRQLSRSKGTGFRVLACGQPRNDECFALASRVKMLERVRTLTRPSGTLSRGERDSKRGKVGVRRDQPLRSRVGEVHLDAGMRA